jgi:hypothetical protein
MEGNGLNLYSMPPLYRKLSRNEVDSEMIHSTKAYYVCNSVAKALGHCRQRPNGKLVHPEDCQTHAEALLTCYNLVKIVPNDCQAHFNSVLECLTQNNFCESKMQNYLNCDHPAYRQYESYH